MSSHLDRIQNWLDLAQKANWSVTTLAKRSGVSVRTLERHFLEAFGKSPKAWMTTRRLKQAVEFLGRAPVKEVAFLVGYAHPSTFSREFKRHASQCPHDLAKPPAQTSSVRRIGT